MGEKKRDELTADYVSRFASPYQAAQRGYIDEVIDAKETRRKLIRAFQFLREHRLVVRPMAGYGLPTCLRITIGTPEQMRLMANTLAEWQEGNGG